MVPRGVRGILAQLIDVERHRDVADRRKADLQQRAGLRENRQHPDFGVDSGHRNYQHVVGKRHGVGIRRVPSVLDSISRKAGLASSTTTKSATIGINAGGNAYIDIVDPNDVKKTVVFNMTNGSIMIIKNGETVRTI